MIHTNYNIKIQHLLICLEVLNINDWKSKNIKRNNSFLNYKCFDQNIYSLIFSIYSIKKNNYTYKLIKLILNKDELLDKYIKKFKYLHNKKFKYYHINNLYEAFNLTYIAIINLYIIYKIIDSDYISYINYYLLV
uniref:Uncharacterized protein n=1 Tax=Centroceras clavulatum TaxID=159503 RepID=A0A4D6WRV5_9FLOR|nr:hypothetical protein [Centroceras clavulatum]